MRPLSPKSVSLRDDRTEIVRAVRALYSPGTVVEIRVPRRPGCKTISGYFDDQAKLIEQIASLDGKHPAIYVTLNPCAPALLARAANRLNFRAETATSDKDIVVRRW